MAAAGGLWPCAVRSTSLKLFRSNCGNNRPMKPGTMCNREQNRASKSSVERALLPFLKQAPIISMSQTWFSSQKQDPEQTQKWASAAGSMQRRVLALFWVRMKQNVKKHWRHEWKKLNRSRSRDVSLRKWQGTQEIRESVQINKHTEMSWEYCEQSLTPELWFATPFHPESPWKVSEDGWTLVETAYTGSPVLIPVGLLSFVAFCRLCRSGLQTSVCSPMCADSWLEGAHLS